MKSTVNYFDLKVGTEVLVINRVDEYDGEKLPLAYSECVAKDDYRIQNGEPLTNGKIHYMYDFELSGE
ncbi:hypothetical protein VPHK567_0066 [Vibrio phage K567]|nr:hypothetical protein MYOV011v1_p0138 [Vibrio phage 6E35.1a]